MKPVLLAMLCHALAFHIHAEIRNGYAVSLTVARANVSELREGLAQRNDLSRTQRRRVEAAIARELALIRNYHLTERLLAQFRKISPAIYFDMNNLRDRRGRPTDLYVRFISKEGARVPMSGASFFGCSPYDEDASQSEYGLFTVAIDIWICDTALNVLAHELGHIQYIVPNLAEYRAFYRRIYDSPTGTTSIGHSASDRSGRMAVVYATQFRKERRQFRLSSEHPRIKFAAAMKDARREMSMEMERLNHASLATIGEYP